jgi:hypothetical protein
MDYVVFCQQFFLDAGGQIIEGGTRVGERSIAA